MGGQGGEGKDDKDKKVYLHFYAMFKSSSEHSLTRLNRRRSQSTNHRHSQPHVSGERSVSNKVQMPLPNYHPFIRLQDAS